jgi:hypothetical protein
VIITWDLLSAVGFRPHGCVVFLPEVREFCGAGYVSTFVAGFVFVGECLQTLRGVTANFIAFAELTQTDLRFTARFAELAKTCSFITVCSETALLL